MVLRLLLLQVSRYPIFFAFISSTIILLVLPILFHKEVFAQARNEKETSEKLENLSTEVQFSGHLKDKIRYDADRKLLIFKGVMLEEEKNELLNMSKDNNYQAAVNGLFQNSQKRKGEEQKVEKREEKVEEILVPGIRPNKKLPGMEQSITTITGEDIEYSTAGTVMEIVREKTPGAFVTEKGVMGFGIGPGGTGKLNIRGVGGSPNTEVLMNVNGRPDFMGLFGHPIPDSYTLDNVEEIEVIRGPSSLLYGNGGMGGVVNIITKRRTTEGFESKFTAAGGSFNTQDYILTHGGKTGKFDYYLTTRYRETDGDRTNSDFHAQNYSLRMGYDISENFRLNFDNLTTSFKFMNPGPDTAPVTHDWARVLMRTGASLDLENKFDKTHGILKFYGGDGENLIHDGFRSSDQMMGTYFSQSIALTKGNTITAGIDVKNFGGDAHNRKSMADFGDHFIQEYAGFVVDEQTLWDRLKLSAGVRALSNSIFGRKLLPQGGISYRVVSELEVRGSVSTGYRSPTVNELFFPFPAMNPSLIPETSTNYEVGLNYSPMKHLSFSPTFFITEIDNLIVRVGRPPHARVFNGGSATHRGFELDINSRPIGGLVLWTNYSFLDPDDDTLASPEHKIGAGLHYHYKRFGGGISAEYVHGLFGNINHEDRLPDYLLVNAKLKYKIAKFIEALANVENLTNKDYELEKDFPMPGTNFYGGLTFSW
ncbi:MAG TPA: TonB-dependent receptor [Candidatus Hypogeohydataceae bacterium YC41]